MASELKEALEFARVLVLTGARQTGKTTLLREEEPFKSWTYLSLDDLEVLDLALKSPRDLLAVGPNLVLDEVQKAPRLLSAVKMAVDREPKRRFVLSGSSHLLLMKKVSESLAGRAAYVELLPFALGELGELPSTRAGWWLEGEEMEPPWSSPPGELEFLLFRGFLPPVTFLKRERDIFAWWRGYVRTYLERDLLDLARITHLPDFRRLMELLALRSGGLLRVVDLARDLGLPQSTVSRYLNLLETSGLVYRLPSFTRNRAKRVIKAPKVYFLDPGLCAHLMRYRSPQELRPEDRARLLETLVFLNLKVIAELQRGELFYFRTYGGREREVDFVLEIGGQVLAFEVKSRSRVGLSEAENLRFLREVTPNFHRGFVVYTGDEIRPLGENIYTLPWWCL
ncbi:ATPase [Thermosulfurimonas dismutans]|uniref:ATPase n=1 Tax=Thermosulfurimonas dismutans TaxID=999894 RepID=A0A179D159_9BACT|nr:ATPase [Thermosulfurimonas dismutans]